MRSGTLISVVVLALAGVVALPALAEPGTDVSAFPWEGELSGTNVYVRSGPGLNYYPATKLNTGDRVLVLGEKFGWYEIVPPPGSFSYIDKSMVERQGDSKLGKVVQNRVYVRAGSLLGGRKTSTQVVLSLGTKVESLGEAEGSYKIVPPRGASLYVSKRYVQFVPPRLGTGLVERYLAAGESSAEPVALRSAAQKEPEVATPPAHEEAASVQRRVPPVIKKAAPGPEGAADEDGPPLAVDSTLPGHRRDEARSSGKTTAAPSEEMSAAVWTGTSGRFETLLTVLESELRDMMGKPAAQQDLASLQTRYDEIAAQTEERLPGEIAGVRVRQLGDMIEVRMARETLRGEVDALNDFRSRMSAERMKIMRRRAEATLEAFDLEGQLRRSYAFAPEKRRYRLVDPETQKTIAYVDFPPAVEVAVEQMIGSVVGIRTAGKRFSPSARVPIAVARSITDLTPRMSDDAVIETGSSSNVENTPEEIAKSTKAD